MKNSYMIEYINENEFRKKERAVKKYNMLAYKKLTFEYYPSIRNGEFLGELITSTDNTKSYELKFKTLQKNSPNSFTVRFKLAIGFELSIRLISEVTTSSIEYIEIIFI